MKIRGFIVVFTLLLAFVGYAQEQDRGDLKVGLVLSGGGAKGMAHIGALKAIDEAGVRIDYIGGTSMGAIVGALYASGYSGVELDSIFRSVDFNKLIQGYIPRGSVNYYERINSERYALSLPFDDFKISFPSSISTGQNVYNLLSRLLFHVNDITDYNELPIPFFCMATDVETGEEVRLDSGYLPLSLGASGAFPSLFEPVEIDGRVLLDGGVVNNYPIDEVRALGADFIIGVDVQDPLAKRDELRSATQVLLQINNYRTVNAMEEKVAKTDIYIKPNIEDFTVISFNQGDSIIANGYEAGLLKMPSLDSLSLLQDAVRTKKPPVAKVDSFKISHVTLSGNRHYSRRYIKGKIRYDTNRYTNFEELEQGMNNLAATRNFSSIHYLLRPSGEDDGYVMDLRLREDPSRSFLKLGLHYDGLYKTAGLINYTRKNLLVDDDVMSFDFIIGDQIRYNFNYYLDKGRYWSLGVNSAYNNFEKDVDFGFVVRESDVEIPQVNKLDISLADLTNQIYAQSYWGEEFVIGAGVEHKWLRIETETVNLEQGESSLEFENSNYLSTYGFLKLDTMDDRYFPTKGLFFDGDFHWYFLATEEGLDKLGGFSIAKANMGFALPLTSALAFNFFTEGGFTLGEADVNSLDFILGGYGAHFINNFTGFLGYDFISFGGDSYVKAVFTADLNVFRNHHLNFMANFANAGNDIFNEGEWFTLPDYTGYAFGYGLETLVGPAQVKYSWSPENSKGMWMFSLGFWF